MNKVVINSAKYRNKLRKVLKTPSFYPYQGDISNIVEIIKRMIENYE